MRTCRGLISPGNAIAMSFKNQIKNDASKCFLGDFSEDITYVSGGTSKIIKAIVNRNRLTPSGEDSGRTLLNQVEIFIANDAVNGIATIDKGVDTVSLPARIGGANVTFVVADILGQDEGVWNLLCTK